MPTRSPLGHWNLGFNPKRAPQKHVHGLCFPPTTGSAVGERFWLPHCNIETPKISTTKFFPAKRLKFLNGVLASILTFQIKNPPKWYDEAPLYYTNYLYTQVQSKYWHRYNIYLSTNNYKYLHRHLASLTLKLGGETQTSLLFNYLCPRVGLA